MRERGEPEETMGLQAEFRVNIESLGLMRLENKIQPKKRVLTQINLTRPRAGKAKSKRSASERVYRCYLGMWDSWEAHRVYKRVVLAKAPPASTSSV